MNADSNPARTRGRPAGDAGDDLRSRLLDVAEERFAEHGFAATSVRSIADEAGVNPALVHYYFGTKRALLTAVLDRVFEPIAAAMAELSTTGDATLPQLTQRLHAALEEHPALPRLVVREVMLSSGEFRTLFSRKYAPRLGGMLPPFIERKQGQGQVRADLDPACLTLLVLSLCIFPFIARPLAEHVLGLDYGAAGLARLRDHIGVLLEHGVHP